MRTVGEQLGLYQRYWKIEYWPRQNGDNSVRAILWVRQISWVSRFCRKILIYVSIPGEYCTGSSGLSSKFKRYWAKSSAWAGVKLSFFIGSYYYIIEQSYEQVGTRGLPQLRMRMISIAEWLERLAANAKDTMVVGPNPEWWTQWNWRGGRWSSVE